MEFDAEWVDLVEVVDDPGGWAVVKDFLKSRRVIGGVTVVLLIGGLLVVGVRAAQRNQDTATQAPAYVAIPGCYRHSAPPPQRPTSLNIVGCASVAVALQDMSWTEWGARGADGSGTAVFKICDPNCAVGYRLTNQVVVHAWNPQPARADATCPNDLQIFADMVVAFPKGVPPTTAQKMNTEFDGMPAVHYANYAGDRPDREFIGKTICF